MKYREFFGLNADLIVEGHSEIEAMTIASYVLATDLAERGITLIRLKTEETLPGTYSYRSSLKTQARSHT